VGASSTLSWEEEDAARARSLTQHLCDTLSLALLVGALNGFVVGVIVGLWFAALLAAAIGALIALVLWIPGSALTWWLVRRRRAGRMTASSYKRGTIVVVALLGTVPGLYLASGVLPHDPSGRTIGVLAAVTFLGTGSGAWAGRRLARLQLARNGG
jgi:hypothetical protein